MSTPCHRLVLPPHPPPPILKGMGNARLEISGLFLVMFSMNAASFEWNFEAHWLSHCANSETEFGILSRKILKSICYAVHNQTKLHFTEARNQFGDTGSCRKSVGAQHSFLSMGFYYLYEKYAKSCNRSKE